MSIWDNIETGKRSKCDLCGYVGTLTDHIGQCIRCGWDELRPAGPDDRDPIHETAATEPKPLTSSPPEPRSELLLHAGARNTPRQGGVTIRTSWPSPTSWTRSIQKRRPQNRLQPSSETALGHAIQRATSAKNQCQRSYRSANRLTTKAVQPICARSVCARR